MLAACGGESPLEVGSSSEKPQPPELPTPRFACAASSASRPMLAARVGAGLYFARPDRTVERIFDFDVPEGMYVTEADVIARGDRIAAYAVVSALGGAKSPPAYVEVIVLDVNDGAVRFYERHPFAYEGWGSDSRLAGNANGLFAMTLLEIKTGLGLVIDDSGSHTFTRRMGGRSDPDAAGRMVVVDYESSSSVAFHFFDTQTDEFAPSQYVLGTFASSATVLGHGILYIARDPARLIFEDASGPIELPIDVTLEDPGHATPGFATSNGWAVFHLGGATPLESRYLTARIASNEARELTVSPPSPFSLPEDSWNPPAIDARGRLLFVLSDGERLQLHATADGTNWEPLGRPITNENYPYTVIEAGGAVIFDGYGSGNAAQGALPAYASQLIGPGGGEGIELIRSDPGSPSNPTYADDELSPDGACLAYFRSGSLHVVEVDGYASADLGVPTDGQSAEMAWIPIP